MEQQEENYSFEYQFCFEDGRTIFENVEVAKDTLLSGINELITPPEWTRLEFQKCKGCKLKGSTHCPVALRLVEPLRKFNRYSSYTPVKVSVETQDRTYSKDTDLQDGLRSMFGLIMATSGCPSMAPFKPMARFHLPFSTIDETVYRVTSMYLLKKFFIFKTEGIIPFLMDELDALYETIQSVNIGIFERLRVVSEKDSALNAVNILDTFAALVPIYISSKLNLLEKVFSDQRPDPVGQLGQDIA